MKVKYTHFIAAALFCALAVTTTVAQSADPLPSWNDGKTKQSILTFVSKVTKKASPEFVPPAERIATFDNDGTLWAEQPLYFQLLFGIDRIATDTHIGTLKFFDGFPDEATLVLLPRSLLTEVQFDRT